MRKLLVGIFLVGFIATMLLPFLWTIASSFKTGAAILGEPWALPSGLQFENYAHAWK